jgi:hypothetical protein
MLLVALGSLIAVGIGVHVALFGWYRAPAHRVDLAPAQRWWVGALIVGPILLGGLIVISRDVLARSVPEAVLAHLIFYLAGFVLSVVFAIFPTAPDDDEDQSSDHTA